MQGHLISGIDYHSHKHNSNLEFIILPRTLWHIDCRAGDLVTSRLMVNICSILYSFDAPWLQRQRYLHSWDFIREKKQNRTALWRVPRRVWFCRWWLRSLVMQLRNTRTSRSVCYMCSNVVLEFWRKEQPAHTCSERNEPCREYSRIHYAWNIHSSMSLDWNTSLKCFARRTDKLRTFGTGPYPNNHLKTLWSSVLSPCSSDPE